jgi:hypothetical protein
MQRGEDGFAWGGHAAPCGLSCGFDHDRRADNRSPVKHKS